MSFIRCKIVKFLLTFFTFVRSDASMKANMIFVAVKSCKLTIAFLTFKRFVASVQTKMSFVTSKVGETFIAVFTLEKKIIRNRFMYYVVDRSLLDMQTVTNLFSDSYKVTIYYS